MTSALTLMDVNENLVALLPKNALEEHTIGTASVEVPFHQHIPSCLSGNALRRSVIIGKGVIFQVSSDLMDLCLGGCLSMISHPCYRGYHGHLAESVWYGNLNGWS